MELSISFYDNVFTFRIECEVITQLRGWDNVDICPYHHMEELKVDEKTWCVKSILRGCPAILCTIRNLVIAVSELESRGSLVYTLALLRCNENEETVPAEMFTQGFMTRCLGSVTCETASSLFRPSEICNRYLQQAREKVEPMDTFNFSGLTQIINQRGRLMHKMLLTSMTMHQEEIVVCVQSSGNDIQTQPKAWYPSGLVTSHGDFQVRRRRPVVDRMQIGSKTVQKH